MDDYAHRLAELRARFVDRASRDRVSLAEAVQNGRWDEARRIAHGLSGIAGTFGSSAIGSAAAEMEAAIDEEPDGATRIQSWRVLDGMLGQVDAQRGLQP